MRLWIRSQNRKVYEEVSSLCVKSESVYDEHKYMGHRHYITSNNGTILGTYESEKRAMEVLDDIVFKRSIIDMSKYSYLMPEE